MQDAGHRLFAIQHHAFAVEAQAAVEEPTRHARVKLVLFGQHARGQARFVVVMAHGNRRLGDDRPAIECRRHEMHAATV